jgi:hypothetical protein
VSISHPPGFAFGPAGASQLAAPLGRGSLIGQHRYSHTNIALADTTTAMRYIALESTLASEGMNDCRRPGSIKFRVMTEFSSARFFVAAPSQDES